MSRTSAEARQSDEWPREIQLIVRRIARHKSRPVKSFISNGPGWEADVNQPGRPWVSGNHFAQCGKLNTFRRGESAPVTIENL